LNPSPARSLKRRGCLNCSRARHKPTSDSSPYFGRRLFSSSVALCRNRWRAASFAKDRRWSSWGIPNLALVRPSCASPPASRYEAHRISRSLSSVSSVWPGSSLARLLSRGCIICAVREPGWHAGLACDSLFRRLEDGEDLACRGCVLAQPASSPPGSVPGENFLFAKFVSSQQLPYRRALSDLRRPSERREGRSLEKKGVSCRPRTRPSAKPTQLASARGLANTLGVHRRRPRSAPSPDEDERHRGEYGSSRQRPSPYLLPSSLSSPRGTLFMEW